MPRFIPAVSVLGLLSLCLAGSNWLAGQPARAAGQQAQTPPGPQRPPLFFREDWKLDPNAPNVNNADEPEHPVGQGDVANPNLEVHVYGDKAGTRISDQTYNNHLTYAMTLLCTSNCAITLRDKNNDVDLTGPATIRWRTRISGFHLPPSHYQARRRNVAHRRPDVEPLDGLGGVGNPTGGRALAHLDIQNVVEASDGYWVDYPDLSRVEEIGFTDLMRGAGHGSGGGSRVDWIEVYGKPVPRVASGTKSSSR